MDKADSTGRLTPEEAALRIGLQPKTLAMMRCRGNGPEFFKIGNRVQYAPEAIDRWLDSKRTTKATPLKRRAAQAEQHA